VPKVLDECIFRLSRANRPAVIVRIEPTPVIRLRGRKRGNSGNAINALIERSRTHRITTLRAIPPGRNSL
jgi:hypothetical protein